MAYHQPSGLHHGLSLLIDPCWSPEQALAVSELLDDLRDRIWAHYEVALMEEYRNEHSYGADVNPPDPSATPF